MNTYRYIYIHVCFSLWVWAHRLTLWLLALVCYGFSWAAERKRNQAFISIPFVPVSTQWTKLPSALFSPCFYWFFGHHDEHPTQPLGHFMVCRSSCNKTLEMERWKGDSKGGKVLTRFSLPWPTVLMLVGPIQQLLPRLWLPTGPKSFSYTHTNDPRGSKNRSCPSLCWHDDNPLRRQFTLYLNVLETSNLSVI